MLKSIMYDESRLERTLYTISEFGKPRQKV